MDDGQRWERIGEMAEGVKGLPPCANCGHGVFTVWEIMGIRFEDCEKCDTTRERAAEKDCGTS